MDIATQNLQSNRGTPALWALFVLIFGLIITYPVLDYVLISHVKKQLLTHQYNSQLIAASSLKALVIQGIEHGESPGDAFRTAGMTTSLGQLTQISAALIAPDGSIASFIEGFQLAGADNLTNYKVVDWPSGIEMGFMEFAISPSLKGKLKRPTGADTGQMICASSLPTTGWHIITTQGEANVLSQLATTRLYLLVAFLILAVFMVLLILSFYFTLAAGLSSAINSARALEDASIRFQEHAGELRRPLHNIQGLADMLAITDDPDERDSYLREIKGEVKLIIEDLERSSG